MESNTFDLIIIGGGPAGFTSAVYAGRAGLKILIIEKETPGGKVSKTYEIENYPPFINIKGIDLSSKMFQQSLQYNNAFIGENVLNIKKLGKWMVVKTNKNVYKSYAIVIATGTKERKLHVDGEEKYFSKGVSTCAVCDGALFKNQIIAVVGGGWSATEEALYLTRFVKKLYLIHRRQKFRTPDTILDKVKKNDKIELILDTVVEKISGNNEFVTDISLKNIKTSEKTKLKVAAIFPYIGQIPNTAFAKGLEILNKDGFVIINNRETFETNVSGIFAAGDVLVKNLRQIANAVGDGANAGQGAVAYIDKIK